VFQLSQSSLARHTNGPAPARRVGAFAAEGRQKATVLKGKNLENQLDGEEVGEPGLLGLRAEFETGDARGHFVEFS
jgi:hypothetical protein